QVALQLLEIVRRDRLVLELAEARRDAVIARHGLPLGPRTAVVLDHLRDQRLAAGDALIRRRIARHRLSAARDGRELLDRQRVAVENDRHALPSSAFGTFSPRGGEKGAGRKRVASALLPASGEKVPKADEGLRRRPPRTSLEPPQSAFRARRPAVPRAARATRGGPRRVSRARGRPPCPSG